MKILLIKISLLCILSIFWSGDNILAKPSIEIIAAKNYYITKTIHAKVLNFEPYYYNMLVYFKSNNIWKVKHINKYSPYLNIDDNNQFQIKFGIKELLINEAIIYILPKPTEPWSPPEIIKDKTDLMGIAIFYVEVPLKPFIKPYLLLIILLLIILIPAILKNDKFKNKFHDNFIKLTHFIDTIFRTRKVNDSKTEEDTEYYSFGNVNLKFNRHGVLSNFI